jgi:hypothetical protein
MTSLNYMFAYLTLHGIWSVTRRVELHANM